jgi:hypothetical protein
MEGYDAECLASQHARRFAGRRFRDFESTVFVVPKKDEKFRLCKDTGPSTSSRRRCRSRYIPCTLVADCIQKNDLEKRGAIVRTSVRPRAYKVSAEQGGHRIRTR